MLWPRQFLTVRSLISGAGEMPDRVRSEVHDCDNGDPGNRSWRPPLVLVVDPDGTVRDGKLKII